VTVRDVCGRADVGRSTFYVHFADKEDLLLSGFGDLAREVRTQIAREDVAPLAFTRPLIEHIRDHWPIARVLSGKRTGQAIHEHLSGVMIELIEEDVAPLAPPGVARDAAVRCLAGGLRELLTFWLEGGARLTVAEVDDLFHRYADPVLAALSRSSG
jgi:AcrR family transcriptional regulator